MVEEHKDCHLSAQRLLEAVTNIEENDDKEVHEVQLEELKLTRKKSFEQHGGTQKSKQGRLRRKKSDEKDEYD